MKLLKNGRDSCTWNSKHITIKYFWVTDRVTDNKNIAEHCPTDQMLADYMSKPVQGSLFKKFREALMGWKHIGDLFEGCIHPEEHVETNTVSSPSYADITRGKSKNTTWRRKLAKKVVVDQDKQMMKEIKLDLINKKNPISNNVFRTTLILLSQSLLLLSICTTSH